MAVGSDEGVEAGELIPARMLNELSFCPRLFYIEHVQREFADNAFTVEGRGVHRRVDKPSNVAVAEAPDEPFHARSVSLSSETLGLSAKIDFLEGDAGGVVPVEYKRGKPPPVPERAYEPERVQVCAYGLLLREHGYTCDGGILYFAAAKTRVEVPFTEELIARTKELLAQGRALSQGGEIPPPLEASPKCAGCSLHAICLPDEVTALRAEAPPSGEVAEPKVRLLLPARDDAKPLYVTEQGARVGISGGEVQVKGREGGALGHARLVELSQLVLWGNVSVSAQAMRELLGREIPVCWLSYGGWLSGVADGMGSGNIELRRAQFRAADSESRCLRIAQRIVRNKIANARTLLRRNHRDAPEGALRDLAALVKAADETNGLPELLGIEGNAARIYFEAFDGMLKPPEDGQHTFSFEHRSRRPPKDPVNALLSMAYSLLARDLTVTCRLVGLDPFLGMYHQPRFGRPALALDLMEEFRPIIADSVVINAVNTGVVQAGDFLRSGLGVSLKPEGRRRFIQAYERRMGEEVTHPVFGYRVSYRRVLEVQVRLFARHLMGEIPEYPEFRTR